MFAKSKHLDGYPVMRAFLKRAAGMPGHRRTPTISSAKPILRALRDVRGMSLSTSLLSSSLGFARRANPTFAQRIEPTTRHHICAARGYVGDNPPFASGFGGSELFVPVDSTSAVRASKPAGRARRSRGRSVAVVPCGRGWIPGPMSIMCLAHPRP